jgi:hypothetical protein
MKSNSVLDPKYAIIVKDKDLLKIPLNLETFPSAKEFRDAIQSLSPEQQRFAKAFRAMQLESTLFALCIIQIKPLLETVLNLLPDSLTKEIQLTQDLMELFIEYQIPADLLSYSGDMAVTSMNDVNGVQSIRNDRISMVKSYVDSMKVSCSLIDIIYCYIQRLFYLGNDKCIKKSRHREKKTGNLIRVWLCGTGNDGGFRCWTFSFYFQCSSWTQNAQSSNNGLGTSFWIKHIYGCS